MEHRLWVLIFLVVVSSCADNQQRVIDPIPDIPLNQQRTVTRNEFGWRWPLTVGIGTLGCVSNAVVFRAGAVTYAVNAAAAARGFAPLEPISVTQSRGLPHDPVKRLRQDDRMRIFAQSAACERSDGGSSQGGPGCRTRVLHTSSVSEEELQKIEREGRERRWPPLPPARVSVGVLVDAGIKLCPSDK